MPSSVKQNQISWQLDSISIGKEANMITNIRLTSTCAVLLLLCSGHVVKAGDCECSRCSCKQSQKVCRLICEDKSVSVVCWGCEDEDFCVHGHSKERQCHCESVCADCENIGNVQTKPKKFVWSEWVPCGPASLHTRRKLMKRTVTKKIPSYKWVVEDLCAECQAGLTLPLAPPVAEIPPLPTIDSETKVLLATHSEPSESESSSFDFESGLSHQ